MTGSRPQLAIFAPLPPSRSGIADYLVEQLPFWTRDWQLTIVIADDAPIPMAIEAGVAVVRVSDWQADGARDLATPRIYQIGNNPDHEFVWQAAKERAGTIVLHDYVLHHLVAHATLGRFDEPAYLREMLAEHGERGRRLARFPRVPPFDDWQYFLVPLNATILEGATGVIVHSRWSHDRIAERFPRLRVKIVPHHSSAAPGAGERDEASMRHDARARLGLNPSSVIVASLGFGTPSKQIGLVMRALATLDESFEYWLVGEPKDAPALSREIDLLGLAGRVRWTGYVPKSEFCDWILAADLIVNLRYPSAGEASGTLARALGAGRACVIFDYASFADVPTDAAIKIPLNVEDVAGLAKVLARAIRDRAWCESIGARARAYAATVLDIAACVRSQSAFVATSCGRARDIRTQYRGMLGEAAAIATIEAHRARLEDASEGEYAKLHARRWAKTLARIPIVDGGRALDIGYSPVFTPSLRTAGYRDVSATCMGEIRPPCRDGVELVTVDFEAGRLPHATESFDLVTCCEVIEHLGRDPMRMVVELARVLKIGGTLVLTTPNIASARSLHAVSTGFPPYLYFAFNRDGSTDRHHVEYSPHEVRTFLEAGGFEIRSLETEDCWSEAPPEVLSGLRAAGHPITLRGDNIIAIATRRTRTLERYPTSIYVDGPRVWQFADAGEAR